ncbi:MAG: hypothetical protein SangKO_052970 [Sandaracinaceae bacterium]
MKLRIYDDAVAMVTDVRAYRLAIARARGRRPRSAAPPRRQVGTAQHRRGRLLPGPQPAQPLPHGPRLRERGGRLSRGRRRADGILDSIDPDVLDRLNKIIGTLVKLAGK